MIRDSTASPRGLEKAIVAAEDEAASEMARQLCEAGDEVGVLALVDAGLVTLDRTPEGEARFSEAIGRLAEFHRFAEQIETRDEVVELWPYSWRKRNVPGESTFPRTGAGLRWGWRWNGCRCRAFT